MAVRWKPGKTNNGFSPLPTTPWKAGDHRRLSTFPQPRLLLPGSHQKTKTQKGSRPLRGLHIQIIFRITLYWKGYLVSGSSHDWKMLLSETYAS